MPQLSLNIHAFLVFIAFISFYCEATSIFINCGGEDLVDNFNQTWIGDSSFLSEGFSYSTTKSFQLQLSNSTLNLKGGNPFLSFRYFGGQNGGINSYNFSVDSTDYYILRLYFNEILYQTPHRQFSVLINEIMALNNFSLNSTNTLLIKEFYIPARAKSSINVTFLRGPLGDPCINAISLQPALKLYPWLNINSSSFPLKADSWQRIYGLDCGSDYVLWPDQAGRIWLPDIRFCQASSGSVLDFITSDVIPPPVIITGANVPPEYLPQDIYLSQRTAERRSLLPSNRLVYTEGAIYRVRLHFIEFLANYTDARYYSVFIDGVLIADNVEPMRNGFKTVNTVDFVSQPAVSDNLEVTVSSSYDLFNPVISGLELFERLSVATETERLPFELPHSPPSPPFNSAPSETLPKASTKKLMAGFLVGAILMTVAIAALILFVYLKGNESFDRTEDLGNAKIFEMLWSNGDLTKVSSKKFSSRQMSSILSSVDLMKMGLFGPSKAQVISYTELEKATGNFKEENMVGRGGFGSVYKGVLEDGTEVAIKSLSLNSSQGEKEFLNEVDLLTRLHHRHLVNLVGFCPEPGKLSLAYEFVPGGTLREALEDSNKSQKLNLESRLKIALGAAKGLEYLHLGATPAVIHRDIKTANILLDSSNEAKVADFGLSRLGKTPFDPKATHVSTAVKGTLGYLDPQYYKTQQLTEKSDIFSFGVVLLEILSGRAPIWMDPPSSCQLAHGSSGTSTQEDENSERLRVLVDWACGLIKNGQVLRVLAPEIQSIMPHVEPWLVKVAELAASCVNDNSKARPTMSEVVRILEDSLNGVLEASGVTPRFKFPSPPKSPSSSMDSFDFVRPLLQEGVERSSLAK